MPTYVYECSQCNLTFEAEQRITEDPLRDCRCGSSGTVKRLIQPVGVMFKGSGFHINDYSAAPPATADSKPAEAMPESPSVCASEPSACACAAKTND